MQGVALHCTISTLTQGRFTMPEENNIARAPGSITQIENIPAELKAIPNWILYYLKPSPDGGISKIPSSVYDAGYPCDIMDQGNFSTFEHAVRIMKSYEDGRFGVGVVLTEDAGILVFDFDYKKFDTPEAQEQVQQLVGTLAQQAPTYCETSISGNGLHVIYRGRLPQGEPSANNLVKGVELYSYNRFIAITGDVPQDAQQWDGRLCDGTELIARLYEASPHRNVELVDSASDVGVTRELGRAIGLTDERVLELLEYRCRDTFNWLTANTPIVDFSEAMARIVGDFDKITGDPGQIQRIIAHSRCLVTDYDPAKEDRAHKFNRLFNHWLREARYGRNRNTAAIMSHVTPVAIEHGREVAQQFMDAVRYEMRVRTQMEILERSQSPQMPLPIEQSAIEHDAEDFAQIIETMSAGDYVRSKFSHLPAPTGVIATVAKWIYHDLMVDKHPDMAIISAWILVANFSGRKDSLKSNPPIVDVKLFAINGAGKDTVRKAINRILGALAQRGPVMYSDGRTWDPTYVKFFRPLPKVFGIKAMALHMLESLSTFMVKSENGIASSSTAGDMSSVTSTELQNFSQDAYEPATFPRLSDAIPSAYGVAMSIFEESTKEAYTDQSSGVVGTGSVARKLSYNIDVSKIGGSQLLDSKLPPEHILDIFQLLIMEAVRGEELNVPYSLGKGDNGPFINAVSMNPVPFSEQRKFDFTPEARARISAIMNERFEFRTKNTQNVASLEWAQRVRREQIVLRFALIHARTRHICSGSPTATEVDVIDLQAAEAMVDEGRRTELANSTDYEIPLRQAIEEVWVFLKALFEKDLPSPTYKLKLGGNFAECWERRAANSQLILGSGTNRKHLAKISGLVASKQFRTNAEATKAVAKDGADLGYWTYSEDDKGKTWLISDVQERITR